MIMKDLPDLYRILQIDPGAEAEVIDVVYRRLARKYHPDVNPSADAHRQMQDINLAYEILGDPKRRSEYDRHCRLRSGNYWETASKHTGTTRSSRARKRWHRTEDGHPRPYLVSHPEMLDLGSLSKGVQHFASFKVAMTQDRRIRGRVMANQPWIRILSPKILHDLSEATIEILVDTSDLRDGINHFGSVSIESLAYGGLTVPITVYVQEEPKPQLRVEPSFLQVDLMKGMKPVSIGTIHIDDEAGFAMSGSLHVKPGWLKASVVDFDAVAGLQVNLTADASNLRVGHAYTGRIEVHASNGRATIVVKVTILPQAASLPDFDNQEEWAGFLSELEASTEWEQSFLQTVKLQARQIGWRPSNSQRTVLEGLWRRQMEKNI